MEIVKVRPARVSAALVAIGDTLVTSPIGANGPRPSTWIGAVTEHVIVEEVNREAVTAAEWRQWRIARPDGTNIETMPIPADGWVWVHLPVIPA